MNKVIIIGNLGRDPEVRVSGGGTSVAKLAIATNERRKEGGEWTDYTEWHRVVLFGKAAELAERYLAKGRKVAIEGRIQTRSWDDQKTGQKRYVTEIVGDRLEFVSGRDETRQPTSHAPAAMVQEARERQAQQPAPQPPAQAPRQGNVYDDDIPF